MSATEPTVFVVDDDPALRRSIQALLAAAGLHAEMFASGREFLSAYDPARRGPGCLVLDLVLPGEDGVDVLSDLRARTPHLPVIMLTAHGSVPRAVLALRAGAIDFLEKPVRPTALVSRIREALDDDARLHDAESERNAVADRARRLSGRERDVATMLIAGKRSKEMASELGISVRTVEGYRARLLEKMQAESAPHLVTMFLVNRVSLRA